MVRFRHYRVVGAVTASMLVATPLFLTAYRDWNPNFAFDRSGLSADRIEVQRVVPFDPDTSNAWCSTVLLPIGLYDWRVTLFPAGVGVSYMLDYGLPLELPVKSRYVLLDVQPSECDVQWTSPPFILLRCSPSAGYSRIRRPPAIR